MKTKIFSLFFGLAGALLCLPINAQNTDATLQQNVEYEQVVINKYKDFRFAVAGGIAYRGAFKKIMTQLLTRWTSICKMDIPLMPMHNISLMKIGE